MEKLVWNVYRCRNGKIKVYNIFQHSMFSDEVKQLLLQYKTKDEFAEESNTLLLQSQKRMGGYY